MQDNPLKGGFCCGCGRDLTKRGKVLVKAVSDHGLFDEVEIFSGFHLISFQIK
jgi:hypothetical protein